MFVSPEIRTTSRSAQPKSIAWQLGLAALVLLAATIYADPSLPQPPPAPPDQAAPSVQPSFQEVADLKTREYLNDLSSRRRVTTLFPNRQSARWGVQENMVNTTKGNLTFLVRDLVRIDPMPIVFGRVYDSSLQDGDDFGAGWRLAVDERIVRRGSKLLYTDATGTTHRLRLRGDRIVPVAPALTPIRSGVLRTGTDGDVIVLQSDDLLRRFEKIGNAYRLIAVSHDRGSLRFSYQDGRLAAIASNAGTMQIKRRPDGRIIAVQDDHGREVSYAYDAAGRLHKAIDRAGGIWEYRYRGNRSGQLTTIIDPRLVTIFEATHRDGRVEWVRVLRRETTFTYGGNNTRAVDVLGRVKVFHHGRSGITDGIEDASGAFTQIIFDDDYRPVEMMRNGEAAARMAYDEEGRLASLWRPSGETTYIHGGKGLISAEGVSKARYRYDDAGRVVQASDGRGERTYTYDGNGGLASVMTDGHELRLNTNAAGIITEIRRGGRPLISHVVADDGRIASTVYGDEERSLAVSYQYNERGFREESTFNGGVVADMNYDDAGNLIHYKVGTPDGKSESQEYEIDRFNEVQRIKTEGPRGAGIVSFRYDDAGRMFEVESGARNATVEHDELDRVSRVMLDGEPLLAYDYEAMDVDVVAAWDALSTEVPAPLGTSSVFGTIESIIYARPRPTDHGLISYALEAGTFRVETAYLVPDAILLSSLARRMMPLRGELVNGGPLGYDKPSNSLFIPPEYFSVNCRICTKSVSHAVISVGRARVNRPTNITVSVTGECYETHMGHINESGIYSSFGFFSGFGGNGSHTTQSRWNHSISFGSWGGGRRSLSSWNGNVSLSHVFSRSGTYTVRDEISCGCASLLTLYTASRTVRVSGELCPAGQCCLLDDYDDLQQCNRVQQVLPISTNGCSTPGGIGNNNRTIRALCDRHDRCYGLCHRSRASCDTELSNELASIEATSCLESGGGKYGNTCGNTTSLVRIALFVFGGSRYRKAQLEHCQCCQ